MTAGADEKGARLPPWLRRASTYARPAVQTPRRKSAVVALVCLLLGLLFGVFRMDPEVAGKWGGYHYGTEASRFENINLPEKIGAASAVLDYRDHKTLRPMEDHSTNYYFDDVGYIFLPQLWVLAFGPIEPSDMLAFQNMLFCVSLIAIAALLTLALDSALAGLLAYAVLIPMHRLFAGAVYHTASQPGLVVPMVVLVAACLFWLALSAARSKQLWVLLTVTGVVGAVFGLVILVRYPVGQGAVLAGIVAVLLAAHTWKRRGFAAGALLVGFWMTQSGLPGVMEMHRDATLGWKRESVLSYFRGPPKHEPWFTLLASVGRYENKLDLIIDDPTVDRLLVKARTAEPKRWPGDYQDVFSTVARDVLFDYIRANPGEFFAHRLQGGLEMMWVVPGVTFMSNDLFAGSPYVSPAKADLVNPRDLRNGSNMLINLRLEYLDLSFLEWMAYLAGLISLIATAVYAVLNWNRQRDMARAVAGLFCLGVLYGASRALIPWYGQDFVLMFWLVSVAGAAWMLSDLAKKLAGIRMGKAAAAEPARAGGVQQ